MSPRDESDRGPVGDWLISANISVWIEKRTRDSTHMSDKAECDARRGVPVHVRLESAVHVQRRLEE